MIGSIIGLLCLAALILSLCCCYHYLWFVYNDLLFYIVIHYFSPFGGGKHVCEDGIVELYHIERCNDPDCSLTERESSFYISLSLYLNNNILDETIDTFNNFEMSLIKDHKSLHPYTGVSVSIVKREKRIHAEENNISPFKFETNEDLELSRRKSVDMENISIIPNKWSSIKETDKPKQIKNIIQTTRLRPKVSTITNTSSINLPPSVINNTIYLDGINQISNTLKSIKRKKKQKSNETMLLDSIIEQSSKDKTNNKYNAIRIGHVHKENST